jgi:hypothetical protein
MDIYVSLRVFITVLKFVLNKYQYTFYYTKEENTKIKADFL